MHLQAKKTEYFFNHALRQNSPPAFYDYTPGRGKLLTFPREEGGVKVYILY